MSDWKTLHLFDSTKFQNEVIPKIKDFKANYASLLQSDLATYILRRVIKNDKEITGIQAYINHLSDDLKEHKTLKEIEMREKKKGEDKASFFTQQRKDFNAFIEKHSSSIFDFNRLITLIVFKECGMFNPHLVLGRYTFNQHIKTAEKSIAQEICSKITTQEVLNGESYSLFTNWLSKEEVTLLMLDFDNVSFADQDSEPYFNDFKLFVQIAVENKCGFIAGMNLREEVLNMIHASELNIQIDMEGFTSGKLIKYKSS